MWSVDRESLARWSANQNIDFRPAQDGAPEYSRGLQVLDGLAKELGLAVVQLVSVGVFDIDIIRERYLKARLLKSKRKASRSAKKIGCNQGRRRRLLRRFPPDARHHGRTLKLKFQLKRIFVAVCPVAFGACSSAELCRHKVHRQIARISLAVLLRRIAVITETRPDGQASPLT